MSHWTFWDWIAYSCMFVAAVGLALSQLPKEAREVIESWSSVFSSPKWSFAPLVLVVIATVIFIVKTLFTPKPIELHRTSSEESVVITPENVESMVRRWITEFNVTNTPLHLTDPPNYFAIQVNPLPQNPITLIHTRAHADYLTVFSVLTISPPHKRLYDALSAEARAEFLQKLRIEIARARILCTTDDSFSSIQIEKLVPITTSLKEGEVIQAIQDMNYALILLRDVVVLELNHAQTTTQPSPVPDTATSPR
jgi:hypothetical protein